MNGYLSLIFHCVCLLIENELKFVLGNKPYIKSKFINCDSREV